jgi:ribose transport system substrate-binding protein
MRFHGLIWKSRMFHRILLLLLTLQPLFLISCKRPNTAVQNSIQTVVLLTAHGQRPYELFQSQYLARLVFLRQNFECQVFDANGDSRLQAKQFEEALRLKPVAIVLSPVEPDTLSPQVSDAVQSGILVIGLGESAATLPCSTHLQVDQKELGSQAGTLIIRALEHKAAEEGRKEVTGRIVELRGDEDSPISRARHDGCMEALQKLPGVILVHDAPAFWNQQGAKERTLEAIRLQHQFDVLYAHNDSMALGADNALGERRAEVLVLGCDGFLGEEGGLTLVNQGVIDATIHQPPLVDLAWQIILRRVADMRFAPKPSYSLSSTVITPKNVNDFLRDGPPALPIP